MNTELHLFIIWENALSEKERILRHIACDFKIVEIINIKWDKDNFSNNITRFYGEKLPPDSFKEIECGSGRFTLVTILDSRPKYDNRSTTKGTKEVNTRVFDAKTLFRKWTGGGHKIHSTNNLMETRRDLHLLLGKDYDNYLKEAQSNSKANPVERNLDRNLTGCIQWKSLSELFDTLNQTCSYLVLRNFQKMPDHFYLEQHGDIDLLVENKTDAAYLINATPVSKKKYRANFKVNINYQTIRFDIRSYGDNYYDRNWQQSMLQTRKLHNGFFIPSDDHYRFSLLYHALIHKRLPGQDYLEILNDLGFKSENLLNELLDFMSENNYDFIEPEDLSVFFNSKPVKAKKSTARIIHEFKTETYNKAVSLFTDKQLRHLKKIASKFV